jgi:allantoin racemase
MSMTFLDVTAQLEAEMGVPVVDPARSALEVAGAMAGSGLRHSKSAYPLPPRVANGVVPGPAALEIGVRATPGAPRA